MKTYVNIRNKINNYIEFSLFKLILQVFSFFVIVGLYQNCENKVDLKMSRPKLAAKTKVSKVKPLLKNQMSLSSYKINSI